MGGVRPSNQREMVRGLYILSQASSWGLFALNCDVQEGLRKEILRIFFFFKDLSTGFVLALFFFGTLQLACNVIFPSLINSSAHDVLGRLHYVIYCISDHHASKILCLIVQECHHASKTN